MAYNTSSAPFWVGTAVYIILGLIACAISKGLQTAGKNQYASLSYLLIAMATFCTWIMWAMTWLMQWHPLIRPIKDFGK